MPAVSKPMANRCQAGRDYRSGLGDWLRDRRIAAGLTQAQLAVSIGVEWHTNISAIENGRSVPAPERLLAYADAVGMDPRVFAARVLQFTHPHAAALLLGNDPRKAFKAVEMVVPERLGKRQNVAEVPAC